MQVTVSQLNTPSSAASAAPAAASRQLTHRDKAQLGLEPCKTCASRTYVDGSNDPGVSFKTPTHVSPTASFAAVSAHEGEHVARAQARAQATEQQVVAQSVTLYMAKCPECGRLYTAGGVTRTMTAAAPASGSALDAWA